MFALITAGVTTLLTVAGIGYYLVALWSARAFLRRPRFSASFAPPVSILKPLRGTDPGMAESFGSHCLQEYDGEYEILFGVSSFEDPAAAAVQRLQEEFPERAIRLILCPEVLGPNGKVSNLTQLQPHARYDYLIINDSDIRVGPRYLAQILAPFTPMQDLKPTGLVTALYRGRAHGPRGVGSPTLGSRLEALGIATEFAPGVLTARRLEGGLHFGLGSTLAVSRAALNAIGGLAPLVDYLADDYQLGARVHAAGFCVELAEEVVETSVPGWDLASFFDHQLRWLRTMRESRPGGYAGLMFSYGLAWGMLNLIATAFSLPAIALFSLVLLFRVCLALGVGVGILGDTQVVRNLWLLPLRDLIALGLWAWSYASDTVTWRGESFSLKDGKLERKSPGRTSAPTAPAREHNS